MSPKKRWGKIHRTDLPLRTAAFCKRFHIASFQLKTEARLAAEKCASQLQPIGCQLQ